MSKVVLQTGDYGMSDNASDRGSVHDGEGIDNHEEDSGSEYQSEDNQSEDNQSEDNHSDDEALSVKSVRSEKSNRSTRSVSGRNSTSKGKNSPRTAKSKKATYSDAYRNFYNTQIEELVRPFHSITQALPASEIGVTVWTPLEKEVLFQKVSALGKDNIEKISSAIETKSESEVHQYLSLLNQGTVEGNVTKALPVFSAADVSAAFEVTKQSEQLLEEYADGLAEYQTRSDQKREEKRHGEYWLLTENIAQEVEEQVMARDKSYLRSRLHDEDEADDISDGAKSDQEAANTDLEADQVNTEAEDEPGSLVQITSQGQEPDQQPGPLEELMVPAAELLDLPMWLRLSRLFMYQSPELGESWDDYTSGHETPSMHHTAFQDFHNLTVSLTRRVVQAAIFQTMTRLRARDKDHPSAAITAHDVRAAGDILDLQTNTRKFWGGVPRRHGLRVYERGSKFSRGQSRAGIELNLEEAEERLGVGLGPTVVADADDDVVQTGENEMEEEVLDPDQYYDDPDLWTEASDAEDEAPISVPDDQQSNGSGDEEAVDHPADDEETQDATRKKQHRKGRMERNFQKAHDAYLEAIDQEISRVQEIDMWDALAVPPPNDIKDEEVEIPRQPVIKRRLSDTANWRTGFEYQPPWELGFNTVQPEAFASMQKRGEQAKKRRRMAYDYLEQKGLVVLPQKAPEDVIIRRKIRLIDADIEMSAAPTGLAAIATTEVFDGVPRRKPPTPLINRALSRASSTREGSYDSTVSGRSAKSSALASRLESRLPAGKSEEELRQAEEKQQAEEQAEEEKRKARAARKALSEAEKLALKKKEQDERNRRAQEKRRKEQKEAEKLAKEEQKRLAKEEKQRAKEEKQRSKAEKRKAIDEDTAQDEPNLELTGDATRSTQPRSKKAKRKSGF
jgi:hypothetical protein